MSRGGGSKIQADDKPDRRVHRPDDNGYMHAKLISPNSNYRGRSYSQFVEEYVNWMVRPDPDSNNNGQAIFLRGFDFPKDGKKGSLAEPVIKIGHDALFMPAEKPVFFPVIMTVAESADHKLPDNEMARRDYVRNALNCCELTGGNQITIDDKPLTEYIGDASDFHPQAHRIESAEFSVYVPEGNNGGSLSVHMEPPLLTSGRRSCVAAGDFFMLKFPNKEPHEKHMVQFHSNGSGNYHAIGSNALYEINVLQSKSNATSEKDKNLMLRKLEEEEQKQKFHKEQYDGFKKSVETRVHQ